MNVLISSNLVASIYSRFVRHLARHFDVPGMCHPKWCGHVSEVGVSPYVTYSNPRALRLIFWIHKAGRSYFFFNIFVTVKLINVHQCSSILVHV